MFKSISLAAASMPHRAARSQRRLLAAVSVMLLATLSADCGQQQPATSIPMSSVAGLNAVVAQLNTSIANLQAAINGLNASTKVTGEVVSGAVDGINGVFQLQYMPSPGQAVLVYRNGIRQAVGSDYSIAGTTITFTPVTIPQPGDAVLADYTTSPQAIPGASSLAFGSDALYSPATQQTVTFSNPGPAATVFSSWTLAGASAANYTITGNTCGLALASNATCAVTIAFNPSQVGSLAATLVANDNAAGSPQTISLTGTGLLAVPTGWANIVSAVNGACIDVVGSASNGALISTDTCYGNNSQAFQFTAVSGGYKITEQSSNIQLDVQGGPQNYSDNSPVGLYSFWGGANEIWNTQPTSDGYFNITVNNSGKCLTANGASVVTAACSGSTAQKWSLIPLSH